MSDETELTPEQVAAEEERQNAIIEMNKLHVEVGKRSAELALELLESERFRNEMTPAAAVSLLRFGVDLERKALLGVEEAGGGKAVDPFDALLNDLPGAPGQTPQEG